VPGGPLGRSGGRGTYPSLALTCDAAGEEADDAVRAVTKRWVFLGQNEMGGAALAALADRVPSPEVVVTRRPKEHSNAVAEVARSLGLPTIELDDLNGAADVLARIRGCRATIGICSGWSQRLLDATLSTTADGWYNLHPSSLPAWRGSDPIGWQLATGESELGCSVHRMTSRIDEGLVVAGGTVPVDWADPTFDALVARRRCGELLGRLAAGVLRDRPQRPASSPTPTTCPPRGVVPVLDPAQVGAEMAIRLVRSFSPFPGIGVAGLGDARAIRVEHDPAVTTGWPGEVRRDGAHAQLRCRDGWVEVELRERVVDEG
jgi:methionyl-tRNA formyltransferase